MLGLEHFIVRRDNIQVVAAGDQTMLIQALEKGTVDATVVDSAFGDRLKQRGFPILGGALKTNIPFVSNGIIARASYLQQQTDTARNTFRARGRDLRPQPQDEIFSHRNYHETPEN